MPQLPSLFSPRVSYFLASWNFSPFPLFPFECGLVPVALSIFHSCAVRGRSFFCCAYLSRKRLGVLPEARRRPLFSSSLSSSTFFLSSSSSSYPPHKTFFPTYSSISSLSTNALSPTGSSIFVSFLAYSSGSETFR